MELRRLSLDAELGEYTRGFTEAYARRSGGRLPGDLPLTYLRRCAMVRGVVGPDGRLVGGYAINATPPLRQLDFVPEDARGALVLPAGRSWEDCCEIVCLWRSEALPPAVMDRSVWPRIARRWATKSSSALASTFTFTVCPPRRRARSRTPR